MVLRRVWYETVVRYGIKPLLVRDCGTLWYLAIIGMRLVGYGIKPLLVLSGRLWYLAIIGTLR